MSVEEVPSPKFQRSVRAGPAEVLVKLTGFWGHESVSLVTKPATGLDIIRPFVLTRLSTHPLLSITFSFSSSK